MKICYCLLRSVVPSVLLLIGASAQNLEVKTPPRLTSQYSDAIQVTRDQVRDDRNKLIAKAMNLTDAEAAAFWPVYDQYKEEMSKVDEFTVKLVTEFADNYRTLTDQQALKMSQDSLALQQARLQVRRNYLPKFAKALPGKKLARFFQVERRLDAVVTLNLAQAVSLVQ